MSPASLRVVHLPTSVGGNPQGLSKHLNLLGVHSESWTLSQNYLAYPCDRVIWNPGDRFLLREKKRWGAVWRAARTFDVIHFNYGVSFSSPVPFSITAPLPFFKKIKHLLFATYMHIGFCVEMGIYKLFDRKLFVHYQGDDARQGDISLSKFRHSIAQHTDSNYYTPLSDQHKRTMIKRMGRLCSQMYAVNPDLLHVLPAAAKFIPYCHISLAEWSPKYTQLDQTRPIRIGHAPSHRAVKGTDKILAALEELRSEGLHFELVLVEGLSNEEARRRYEAVDILIDQLYAGWYGGLAVEAMALGKPVIVYIRDEDLHFIPEEMRRDLPFIPITPETVQDTLRQALSMPRQALFDLAHRSRMFVEKWHDPLKIASEIKADYDRAFASSGQYQHENG